MGDSTPASSTLLSIFLSRIPDLSTSVLSDNVAREVLTDMAAIARSFVLVLILTLSGSYLIAQSGTPAAQQAPDDAIFTISIAAPTPAKDVQVRYFLTDQSGVRWSSTAAVAGNDKLVIHADAAGRTPKSFSAIAYAPGCQFVTFTAQDLSTSTRQGDFQCQKLPTVEFRGKVALPPGDHQMQVESMYVVRWAGKFFAVPGLSISPLAVTKATVDADGSFIMDLPDFTNDPLWDSLSHDATLMFFLTDGANGHRVAGLKAPAALSRGGNLKVAATYPEVTFTIRQTHTAKAVKAAQ
jgi:hypothetical protein